MQNVHVLTHPLILHKLTIMRKKETSTRSFRQLLRELSMLMAYEVTRDMATTDEEIETPLMTMRATLLYGKKLVFVSVLSPSTGMLDGMLETVTSSRVGNIGLYRDPTTRVPVEYYFIVPAEMQDRDVV